MPNTKANLNVPLSLPFSRHRTFFPGTGYSYSNSFGERIVSKGDWLLYENRQTSKLKTMVKAPLPCTILCFLFPNCDWINEYDVSIGQQVQNDRNAIERYARSGPKESKKFPNHFPL